MTQSTNPTQPTGGPSGPGGAASAPDVPETRHSITDFVPADKLQALQDSFAAVTRMSVRIRDELGRPVTRPTDPAALLRPPTSPDPSSPAPDENDCDGGMEAPIVVDGRHVGIVEVDCERLPLPHTQERDHLRRLCVELGVPERDIARLLDAAEEAFTPSRNNAINSLFILADHLTRLCNHAYELRERIEELQAINKLTKLLTGHQTLQQVLDAAARSAVEVLGVKACSIRLLDETGRELKVQATHNLSPAYVAKGPILLEKSAYSRAALEGEIVYVENMPTDPRTVYPDAALREGVVSMLAAGIVYKNQKIGTVQVYTGRPYRFSRYDINLLQSFAQLTAAAVHSAQAEALRSESEHVQRQLDLAADVQRRMLPHRMPDSKVFDIAARYFPSLDLSGDFYDFIRFSGGHLGLAVGDVAGKGVAASLLMASVRASLRAFAQDLYDIDQIMHRVNRALCRDTLPNEFVTLFYGVLNPLSLRLTYCNAGHDTPLLLRDNEITRLDAGGMIVGVDPDARYDKGVCDLRPGDTLLLNTDGLTDSANFNDERFGRDNVIDALRESAHLGAEDTLNHILWRLRRFTGLKPPVDDTTLVVIKVRK